MIWGGRERHRCDKGGGRQFCMCMGYRGPGRVDTVVDCMKGDETDKSHDMRDLCGFSQMET